MKPFTKSNIQKHQQDCGENKLQYVFPALKDGKVFCPIGSDCPDFQQGETFKLKVFEHVVKDHDKESSMKWGYNYDLISRIVNQASVADEEKIEDDIPQENEG
jgi:hypothetical protein